MKPIFLNTELINTIIERQLDKWDEARENFFRLRHAERRSLALGALQGAIQYNPARIRSTGASIDSKSIAARPCFLCRSNRPEAQDSFEWMEGWEFLVNPFPILPVHFTIVSKNHVPQDHIPAEMASMAEYAPDLVFFFNGARAGRTQIGTAFDTACGDTSFLRTRRLHVLRTIRCRTSVPLHKRRHNTGLCRYADIVTDYRSIRHR